jgi:hypothetical protein
MTAWLRRTLGVAGFTGLLAIAAALPALAQTAGTLGPQQFRDPKTGQIWTPENVGGGPAPTTPADRAFNPQGQAAAVPGMVVQAPSVRVLGSVPLTAGPTVPIAVIDDASLSVIPGQRWQVTLYLNNNSAGTINPVIDCRFTNGGQLVESTRASLPPIAGGQRVGLVVYGPTSNLFVDRSDCQLAPL